MTAFSDEDRAHMARALALAERGLYTTSPNPRVGCVIVADGVVIGEGFHERAGAAHAEANALADARARGRDPRGATLYVTLEPCNHVGRTAPCTEALVAAGVGRVVAAMKDPNPIAGAGTEPLRAAGIAVELGLLEDEARELNIGFVSRMARGRPWVRMKAAASLDGRTALASGESKWITGDAARADGHHWRARACAILTGIGTVRMDDPELTVRAVATTRQPLRVVIDRSAQTPPTAKVLEGDGVLIVTAGGVNPAWPSRVAALKLPDANGRVDLAALMRTLGERGINELHVEAGGKLNGALLAAGLVDELLLYVAPSLLGDPACGIAELPAGLSRLADRIALSFRDVARVGDDLRVLARLARRDLSEREGLLMFTGIVQAVGRLAHAAPRGDGLRIAVDIGVRDIVDVRIGDSIAIKGCCLTVVAIDGSTLGFDVSAETLRCTTGLDRIGDVNVELALRLADRLGGHLVAGHVDGIGTVTRFSAVSDDVHGSRLLEIDAPRDLARFIAAKGSIAIDGVSLTVNGIEAARFKVNLIPHTLAVTTLGRLEVGAKVNLEVDLVARYVERLWCESPPSAAPPGR